MYIIKNMNKRNFLKISFLSLPLLYLKNLFFFQNQKNKLVLKKYKSKVWFLNVNDI